MRVYGDIGLEAFLMTSGKIQRTILVVPAVLAVSATPATAQTNSTEPEPSDFGSEWPPLGESGFSAIAAAASDWFAIIQIPAQARAIEQSLKDGSIIYTQHGLSTSPSIRPDTVWSFDTAGPLAGYPFGSFGAGAGQFDRPSGIAIDINDEIYIADTQNDRVQIFDNSVSPPVFARQITGGGFGETLECSTAVEYFVNEVYVLTGNDEVRVYNPFGDLDRSFGSSSSGASQTLNGYQPSSLAIDATQNHVLVSDCGNDRVQIFDLAGGYIGELGVGEAGSDKLYGFGGNDTIFGRSGTDRMWGGDDILNGMGGQDTMWGELGNDTMQGNDQSDMMRGGDGNDTIRGTKGKDLLYGEIGNDALFGGDNTDYLEGGPGTDAANGQAGMDNPLVVDISGCDAETQVSC